MQRPLRRWLAAFLAGSSFASTILTFGTLAQTVVTEDSNRDGGPDVWHVYDRDGQLAEVAHDTNLDGRPDIREYYDHAFRIRRESDRNFNSQIDLVEDY